MTTYIANDVYYSSISTNSVATDSGLNISQGDILIIGISFEGATTTVSVTDTAGNSYEVGDVRAVSTSACSVYAYTLNAIANSNNLITATLGANRAYRYIEVLQFRPTSVGGASFDVSNYQTGTNSSLNSGNITTTGTDEIVVGFGRSYTNNTFSSENIGGETADLVVDNGVLTSIWYKLYSETKTNIAATATISWASWIAQILSIKIAATSSAIPIFMHHYANH